MGRDAAFMMRRHSSSACSSRATLLGPLRSACAHGMPPVVTDERGEQGRGRESGWGCVAAGAAEGRGTSCRRWRPGPGGTPRCWARPSRSGRTRPRTRRTASPSRSRPRRCSPAAAASAAPAQQCRWVTQLPGVQRGGSEQPQPPVEQLMAVLSGAAVTTRSAALGHPADSLHSDFHGGLLRAHSGNEQCRDCSSAEAWLRMWAGAGPARGACVPRGHAHGTC